MSALAPLLDPNADFPDSGGLYEPKTKDGLCFIGGNLLPRNLLKAYRNGVFPWSVDPISWWSPEPRAIFDIQTSRLSRRIAQMARQGKFRITFDTCFPEVMSACARTSPKRLESWIADEFITAYSELHRAGHAHSCEVWLDDALVGGIYGVSLGGLFAGESMFSTISNASSVGLYHLFERLKSAGFTLFDSQVSNPHTLRLGAIEISRQQYLSSLSLALQKNSTLS